MQLKECKWINNTLLGCDYTETTRQDNDEGKLVKVKETSEALKLHSLKLFPNGIFGMILFMFIKLSPYLKNNRLDAAHVRLP